MNQPEKPNVLDLFGGIKSQTHHTINVDRIALEGVRADINAGLPFRSNSIDEIVASGPRTVFLEDAARVLKKGGLLFINATTRNGFRFGTKNGRFPSQQELDRLGLRVLQQFGPLPDRFSHLVFRLTNGTPIPTQAVKTTIFEKVK
jgi:SAM-dependent methyltransferase